MRVPQISFTCARYQTNFFLNFCFQFFFICGVVNLRLSLLKVPGLLRVCSARRTGTNYP